MGRYDLEDYKDPDDVNPNYRQPIERGIETTMGVCTSEEGWKEEILEWVSKEKKKELVDAVRESVDSFIEYIRICVNGNGNRGLTLTEMLDFLYLMENSYVHLHPDSDKTKAYFQHINSLAKCVSDHSASDVAGAMPQKIYDFLSLHYEAFLPEKVSNVQGHHRTPKK